MITIRLSNGSIAVKVRANRQRVDAHMTQVGERREHVLSSKWGLRGNIRPVASKWAEMILFALESMVADIGRWPTPEEFAQSLVGTPAQEVTA